MMEINISCFIYFPKIKYTLIKFFLNNRNEYETKWKKSFIVKYLRIFSLIFSINFNRIIAMQYSYIDPFYNILEYTCA
jgi:hypothetical protein